MPTIIAHGEARNLANTKSGQGLAPDPTLRKFVTFLTDTGSVHTIIVDADHAAQDAQQLLDWFTHTKIGVEASHSSPLSKFFKTADTIIADANKALGFIGGHSDTTENQAPAPNDQGVF